MASTSTDQPATKNQNQDIKLWFHFADVDDEEEAEEIERFVNVCYKGKQAVTHIVDEEKGEVQWILLEATTKEAEDVLVGAIRFITYIPPVMTENAKDRKAFVDVLCAVNDSEVNTGGKYITQLLKKIEMVAYNAGVENVVINVPSWRMDELEKILENSGFKENSGFLLETSIPSATGFDITECKLLDIGAVSPLEAFKPVMIMEFSKQVTTVFNRAVRSASDDKKSAVPKIEETGVTVQGATSSGIGELTVISSSGGDDSEFTDQLMPKGMAVLMKTLIGQLHDEYD